MSTPPSPSQPGSPATPAVKAAPSLLKAAGLIALVTLLSKFLGLIRDWAIMYMYGASLATDAYYAAFQIPSFAIVLLGGLGGPFHTATVAIFAKLIPDAQKPGDHANRLANVFLLLTGGAGLVLSVLVFLLADPIMNLLLPGADSQLIHTAAAQMRVMSPIVLIGSLVGIYYGLLNVYNSFLWPSLSPTAMSIVILIGLLLNPDDQTGMVLAWATLGGAVGQFVLQLPDYTRFGFRWRLPAWLGLSRWRRELPELNQLGEMLFPAMIGTTTGQLNVYVDMFFTSRLAVGGWSAVTLSNRLMQFPIGILQTALLVPIFPRFSRSVGSQDWDNLRRDFHLGVVTLWLISIPMLVALILYVKPIIALVFQHGRFSAEDTDLVSMALIFQSFQMLPYFARDSITRVFYAFGDSRTPLMVGLASIVFKALLDWALVDRFGVGGITFSTALVTLINMTLLFALSRRHIADMGFRRLILPFLKLTLAGALMALLVIGMDHWLGGLLPVLAPPRSQTLIVMTLTLAMGTLLYSAATLLLKVEEAAYLFARLREPVLARLKRR
ncbi:MAG: murein biosynthesis integral membrane protein MurJ [Candidatus Melainabacteria bacterium]